MKVRVLSTTDIHQVDLCRRQRTKSSLLHMVRCLFSSLSLRISIIFLLLLLLFFQSIDWNKIIDRCRLFTSDFYFFSLSLFPVLSPSPSLFLRAKMSSTHFINFTYMRNSPSSPYIPPPIQSMFTHVRIFHENEGERAKKNERNYILAEEIFSSQQRRKKGDRVP